jgi:2-amino-4-hydroxy-6-hydroxymethyldihydropteridine diphosphokinase
MSSGWRIATVGRERDDAVVYLGLGTNLGDRRASLAGALRELMQIGRIDGVSSVWESAPVGPQDQPDFWNMVVRLRTALSAEALVAAIRTIEGRLGRTPTYPQGPRVIDIDILTHGDTSHSSQLVVVPHPRMMQRAFVLRPLLELEPSFAHPVTGERADDRLAQGGFERIRRLFPGTDLLAGPA